MARLDLSQEARWLGHFWLPDEPGNRQPGVLTYVPGEGLHLSLIGGFSDAAWIPRDSTTKLLSNRTRRWPLIQGHAERESITLLGCAEVRGQMAGTGTAMYRQEIRANSALVGIHIPAIDAPVFSGIELEVENLGGWASEPDMTIEIEIESAPRRWRVQTEPQESRFAEVEGTTIELGRRYTLPDFDPRRGSSAVSGEAVSYMQFQSKEPKALGDWINYVPILQDLLSLALDTPCGVVRQVLIPAADIFEDAAYDASARILLLTNEMVVPRPTEPGIQSEDALFTLKDVDFAKVLPAWLAVRRQFLATCNMVIGAMYLSDPGYLASQVVTAVTAAEAMHRALSVEPPIPQAEFNLLKKQLVEIVPADRRQWLREKLGRNDHTLRQRLEHLVKRLDPSLAEKLLPNPEKWAAAATSTRNGIAHEGGSTGDVELMYAVVKVTQAVVKMNLLSELGISVERLQYALATNRDFRSAARQARERWPAVVRTQE
ncbi:hypothetical protein O6072_25070 [Mycolicibacterium neoaurum]|uniref:ApeA N-terminal domain 1-containing protein n=1 Tax=Mycolicibacterium neoaurum TaxID=1795 RepID=UPI00248AB989|nr:HEPN domain-containing protein [Mycolicibacterium neoaurum]WBP92927.1 hypothetical protein O7W24_17305 [Mycolicibacterium neoaurum]WBS08041.1 hypothetical protein O6072_25070 [Mycolicibacterium neoaurum]